MPTKGKIEEELQELTGLEIEWSKLDKDDMEEVERAFKSGQLAEKSIKHVAKSEGSAKVEELVEGWYPGKYVL